MHALPEGFRAAMYYADVHGYTYAETAALLKFHWAPRCREPHVRVSGCASRWLTSTHKRGPVMSAEHRLAVDVEQILLGAVFDAWRIAAQRHRDFVAGIAHYVERQLDRLGVEK